MKRMRPAFTLLVVACLGLMFGSVCGVVSNQLTLPPATWLIRLQYASLGHAIGTNPVVIHRRQLFDPDHDDVNVLMLGDSLTAYNDWNRQLHRCDIDNYALPGDTSLGLLARIEGSHVRGKTVVVMIGINDLSHGLSVGEAARNIEDLIDQLAPNNRVVLLSTLLTRLETLNVRVTELDKAEARICERQHCMFLDLNAALAPGGVLGRAFAIDDVHVNNKGYGIWAATLKPLLPPPVCLEPSS